jgi:carbonic anhydrase
MRKLIRGIAEFRRRNSPEQKSLFARLALGQAPDSLFVCCSDSRVAPNVFASTDPGDLFVVRNVGNLVPCCDAHGKSLSDRSEGAAIEFALANLNVTDVIVCGHSECGAMAALLKGVENIPWPNLRSWVAGAGTSLARLRAGEEVDSGLSEVNRLSQLNVLQQTENLLTYPIVRERVDAGQLSVHAWWFDIGNAEVLAYDPRTHKYQLVDEWAETVAVTGPVKRGTSALAGRTREPALTLSGI